MPTFSISMPRSDGLAFADAHEALVWPGTAAPLVIGSSSAAGVFFQILAIGLAVGLAIFIAVLTFKGLSLVLRRIGAFIVGVLTDAGRLVGSFFATCFYFPLILLNTVLGRWSKARHYGSAQEAELAAMGRAIYRILIKHPARLLGLAGALEGVEQRVPEVIAHAPAGDTPSHRTGQFDGYRIIGSLPGGGSGGKLYIAEPDPVKLAALERSTASRVGQVVIKSFSLRDGSSLPQIVRESRSLDAAKRLGLVLDHDLTPERFYYVMRYVPGESLTLVTQRMHADSEPADPQGLDDARLRTALTYVADLLATLETYHRGGLWHKDVKPDNIIVDGKAAHLVDFGLVTPLHSAMTLTTHGTEYFRDPEMVRLALRGAKVQDVDGARFDLYAAGAVLYAVIENSFPAHGVLSHITHRCPESVKWIIRRAMADYDKRYANASAMLADLRVVLEAQDMMAVKPGHLPSMSGSEPRVFSAEAVALASMALAAQANPPLAKGSGPTLPTAPAGGIAPPPLPAVSPRSIRVTNWWTGKFETDAPTPSPTPAPTPTPTPSIPPPPVPAHARAAFRRTPAGERPSARDQVSRARERAHAARERAKARIASRPNITASYKQGPNLGVMIAAGTLVMIVAIGLAGMFTFKRVAIVEPDASFAHTPAVSVVELELPSGHTQATPADAVLQAAAAGEQVPVPATILLVADARTPWSDDRFEALRRLRATLESNGVRVVGDLSGTDKPIEEQAREVGWSAEIRAAVGLASIETPGAQGRVIGWLGGRSEITGVVWAKPEDLMNPGSQLQYFVIVPDRPDASPQERAAVDQLRTTTVGLLRGDLPQPAPALPTQPARPSRGRAARER